MPDERIVITADDVADARVDAVLAQQVSFGMGAPPPPQAEDVRTGLLYRPWFSVMIAGAVGGFLAWAVLEPFFDDGLAFTGNVEQVTIADPQLFESPQATLTVSGTSVYLMSQVGAVLVDGEPAPRTTLAVGQVVHVRGEALDVENQKIVVANEIDVLPDDHEVYPPVDLHGLEVRDLIMALAMFPIVAAFVGLFVGAADGIVSRSRYRALVCGVLGMAVGLGVSLVTAPVGQVFYGLGQRAVQWVDTGEIEMSTGAFLVQMMVRGVSWALIGLGMGLGQGIAMRSPRLLVNGLIGGSVGSLLGGLLFDPIDLLVSGGHIASAGGAEISRGVGFTVIGACTGLMIGVVELLARDAWVKLLTGPLAGKEFVLYRNPTRLGSSPKSDIYLFKDSEVEPTHALLQQVGEHWEIEDQQAAGGTQVNGSSVRRRLLVHGDQIKIGKTVLRFAVKES